MKILPPHPSVWRRRSAALVPAFAVLLATPGTTQALGIFGGFVLLSTNGGSTNTFYDTDQSTLNPDFTGNILTISGGTSLLLGGQVTTFPGAGNANGADLANINYKLDAGSFAALGLPFARNVNANSDDQWERLPGNVGAQLGNRLDVGTHTLSIYFNAQDTNGNGGTVFLSNSGSNYNATFTVTAGTYNYTGSSGNLSDATKYAGGLAPGNGHNLQFNSTTNPAALNNDALTSAASLSFGPGTQTLSGNALGVTTGNVAVSTGATAAVNLNLSGNNPLNKTGDGTLNLGSANAFTGATTVSAGRLTASVAGALGSTSSITVNSGGTLLLAGSGNLNRINNNAAITLAGGTLARDATAGSEGTGANRVGGTVVPPVTGVTPASSAGFGALTLTASSTLDFGTGTPGTLTFGGLSFSAGNLTLNVLNFDAGPLTLGTQVADGDYDRLIFGQDQSNNLARISFNGVGAQQIALDNGYYEIVPVPEPGTWAAGLMALGALGGSGLRRRARSRAQAA